MPKNKVQAPKEYFTPPTWLPVLCLLLKNDCHDVMLTHPFENLLLRAKACNKETCCRKLHALYNTVSSEMNVMVINLTINQICFEREIQIKYGLLFLYAIGIPYFSNSSNFSTFQNTTDYQNLNPKGQYAIRQQTDFITGVSLETGPALPCSF